jgi:hypothetical protein
LAVSGCVRDFNVRVCTTSADQVWMFACAAIHVERIEFVSAARALKFQIPSTKLQRKTKDQIRILLVQRVEVGFWSFIGTWNLELGTFTSAKWE